MIIENTPERSGRSIEDARVFRLRMPLNVPYRLSFGEMRFFDMFLVRVQVDGREGLGESTPLTGYSHETGEVTWRLLKRWIRLLPDVTVGYALESLKTPQDTHPFSAAALVTALESATADITSAGGLQVPLLGTVMSHREGELEAEIDSLLQQGYTTLKVKVGWNERQDTAYVRRIQDIVGDRAVLRLDANQAYTLEQATYLVRHVDPGNIELLEQPFGVDDWEATERLSEVSPLPLMLDEAIISEAALEKAIRSRCARAVKFKLMKAGGLEALERLILRAREAGLKVVLGNGVAGDIGNFHELVTADRHVDTAGEMNGFLKQRERLLSNPYELSRGRVVSTQGYTLRMDWEKVEAYTVDSVYTADEISSGVKTPGIGET